MLNPSKKVLILTGPCGSGKSTVAELLAKTVGFAYVDGDDLDTEFFPSGGQWLSENIGKVRLAHEKILTEVKRQFQEGKQNVVLDYIIFADYEKFFEMFRQEFGGALEIRVLFPSHEENLRRDTERTCWTTGAELVTRARAEFTTFKDMLGEEAFIDTTGQTPEVTARIILKSIQYA